VRDVLERAHHRLGERDQRTILFLDEVHRFNKAQQDALLPGVESGLITLIGATTENPFFEVNPPLLSRSTLFRLDALGVEAARQLVAKGLAAEGADADDDAILRQYRRLAMRHHPDRGGERARLQAINAAMAILDPRRN